MAQVKIKLQTMAAVVVAVVVATTVVVAAVAHGPLVVEEDPHLFQEIDLHQPQTHRA